MPTPDPVTELVGDLVGTRIGEALDGARMPALVVTDLDVPGLTERPEVTVVGAAADKPDGHFRTVLLAATDPADLRAAARRLGALGWARVVAVVVADTDRALTLRPDPAWPALTTVDAEVGWTRVELDERTEAVPVLRAFARAAARPVADGQGGLRVARPGDAFDDPLTKHPPDLLVDPPSPPVVSEATGRAPVTVTTDHDPGVSELRDLLDLLDPVDEAVFSPVGFARDWTRPVVDLDLATRLGPGLVRDLRDAQGVRPAPGHDPRVVVGLAMSGVPLLGTDLPPWLPTTDFKDPADRSGLADPLRREELSIRQRRAALTHRSVLAARTRLAAVARVRAQAHPTVSLLLPVGRPDRLAHALAQVTRQRRTLPGAEVELVLAAHGFTPDPDLVGAASELGDVSVSTLHVTTDKTPGALLREATAAAAGDLVMTLGDRDHHGPDLVTDLLLARRYSGADVVGAPVEWTYHEDADVTTRRRVPTECYGALDPRGPFAVERSLVRALGSRHPGDPDPYADLLDRLARAGGTAYRTHGLGLVAHLTGAGPGADPGPDPGTDPATDTDRRPGFRPSALLGRP